MDIADFIQRDLGAGLGDLGELGIAFRAVERVINQAFPQLYDMVEERYLPREKPTPRGRVRRFDHYGCGVYGCVLPTGDPNLVFKITTDISEVVYLEQAHNKERLPHGPPEGVVKFPFYLPFPEGVTYRRQPVYALWREAVDRPGGLADDYASDSLTDGEYLATMRLTDVKDALTRLWSMCVYMPEKYKARFWYSVEQFRSAVIPTVDNWDLTEPLSMKNTMDAFMKNVQEMEITYSAAFLLEFARRSIDVGYRESQDLKFVKQALWYLANNDLYICDAHLGNMGLAHRRGSEHWVISDVGQTLDWRNPGLWVGPARNIDTRRRNKR